MKKLYLDHNATSPLRPDALEAMVTVMRDVGNASSIHSFGRSARKHVEDARQIIGASLDVSPNQVIFNSGATEGNNTILKGFAGQRILVSSIEHPSVIECGVPIEPIPVTQDGVIDMAAFERLLNEGVPPALISVMLVNNETGVIQPVAEIAKRAKEKGCLVHCDAVQAYGRIPFTRAELGADFLTLSAHKIGGPQGVGAIIMAPAAPLPKLLIGGGQERRHRAGTENIAGITGFGVAAQLATSQIPEFQNLATLRDKIEAHIECHPRITCHGNTAPRVANTISMSIKGVPSETLLMAFDLAGVALSSGSACSSGTVKFSHVLKAMGVAGTTDTGHLRLSLGWSTTEKEVEDFLVVWDKLAAQILKS